MSKVQSAVKKETLNIAVYTCVGVLIMIAAFFVLSKLEPDYVPFDYKVIIGALAGGIIAVLNFFLMGLAVQKVASTEEEDNAKAIMKNSYRRRLLLQLVWVIVAISVPVFNWVAGILPLFFPSLGIKIKGIISNYRYSKK
jgi:membrane protein YqaA with SNARE-associated domain